MVERFEEKSQAIKPGFNEGFNVWDKRKGIVIATNEGA
jgi:hypothetical protein